MDSIEWLQNITKNNKDRIFLIDETTDSEISFEKLQQTSCDIANFLIEQGFSKGDRISIMLDEPLVLSYLYFAMLYSGIIVVPINPILTKEEVEHIVIDSKSKGIITSKSFLEELESEKFHRHQIKIIVYNNEEFTEDNTIELNFKKLKESEFIPLKDISSTDEMIVIYTSGTTSQPKAVIHRISDLVKNARIFGKKLNIGKKSQIL